MNSATFRAMGTDVVALGDGADLADRVGGWFTDAEAIFSRFMPSSELSAVNDSLQPTVPLSPTLASCLAVAQDLRHRTGGLVDPAIGSALIEWGYDTTFADVADRLGSPSPRAVTGWRIDGRRVSRRPGTRLDLGGIAKGWTCDQAVERGLADVVSAGGDVRSAHHDTVVNIEDPWGDIAVQVVLGIGGLATSSTTRRRWKAGAEDVHHIIDPRNQAPAVTPVYSATVMAATAVEAEAGAKAVLLHGQDGLAWAERQPWIEAALVVWNDGNVFATTGWEMAA
jgi:thiamine biosynthesis lipoprotein